MKLGIRKTGMINFLSGNGYVTSWSSYKIIRGKLNYRNIRCKFINLDEALTDPVYQNKYEIISNGGFNFLQKASKINKFDLSKYSVVPREAIENASLQSVL